MHRLLLIALIVIGHFSLATADDNNLNPLKGKFHSVSTIPGDGTYSLLRRYKLLTDACNLEKFYEINGLKKNQALIVDKEYKLPIMLYTYNGTSIRSTLSIDDLQQAIRIKIYNEEVRKAKLRSQNFIESKILWVPYGELHCSSTNKIRQSEKVETPPSLEPLKTEVKEKEQDVIKEKPVELGKISATIKKKVANAKVLNTPLFGKKHGKTSIKSAELKNEVYYIVSGHGGPDPGARCTDCSEILCEDEYAYDVGLRLAKNLMERGATVHVIIQDTDGIREDEVLKCDRDETCLGKLKIPRNQKLRLLQRTTAINDLYKVYKKRGIKTQKTISLHIDSNVKKKKMDAYFCYYKNSDTSKKLATNMKNTFEAKYAYYQKDRGYHGKISPRNFYILKNTAAPAVLVELANIKNSNNQKRFTEPSNRQLLADWLYEGLTDRKL